MPKSKGKGKKRKKGGKKKGKKKEAKVVPEPPPLHSLTDLYNQLLEKVGHLQEMRIMSRKKRLEGWFMTREMSSLKSDNEIYHDYLDDNINELHELIMSIMDNIEKEKTSIQKEIDRLLTELEKRHVKIKKRTEEIEEELARVKLELMEFEPLMQKLAKMLGRLEQLAKDIAEAELQADIKTRHLKNQFLYERGKLHNHLEKQLFDLIQNCRSYIMPILWHHMRRTQFQNGCTRWKLAKADAKNIRLGEQRDDLMLKRKLQTLERSYIGIDWAIFKLSEVQQERRKRQKESRKVAKPPPEEPPTELALAFNIYLKKRLTAYHEAKRRAAKAKKLEMLQQNNTLKEKLESDIEFPGEMDGLEEEWEDVEDTGGEGWDPFGLLKKKKKRQHRRKPKYFSAGGEEEGGEWEGDEEYDTEYSTASSFSSSKDSDEDEDDDDDDHDSDTGEDWGKLVTRVSKADSSQINARKSSKTIQDD